MGPNSNTFTAWIAKQVPELELDLPFSAIGSGYVDYGKFVIGGTSIKLNNFQFIIYFRFVLV